MARDEQPARAGLERTVSGPLATARAAGADHAQDALAEKRYAYAMGAVADGAWQEAAEMFEQTLDRAPDWIPAWIGLGEARLAAGDRVAAAAAFRQGIARDPADRHGAALRLAAIDPAAVPSRASPAYVTALFDAYAERFDTHLTGALGYGSPADLVGALASLGRERFAHVLDLGCGTGLGGLAFRARTQVLSGVDLSSAMIAVADDKAIYDRLVTGDLVGFLQGEPAASADLVLAADVFVYIGDLAPVLGAVARVLNRGGAIAFTVQRNADVPRADQATPLQGDDATPFQVGPDTTFQVGPDMRFAHGAAYVAAVLAAEGFILLVLRQRSARREKGCDVPGLVVVASRS